ncbi:2' O-ribose methyltransferase [Entomophthora muscae]|uniref:2' O-ribose methyltransferase n=1 Tax=Entomophthora muscae TaxID=34485 RepID=A0ACC2SLZ1_9FUNG|nr:2' O-ribose methyltransferase [Entomophthora muscae]
MDFFQKSMRTLHKFSSTKLYNFQPVRLKSSKRWIQRQTNDHFVQKAASSNYRARSAFKLLEIEEKFSIFKDLKKKKSQVTKELDLPLVIDCGACPGGWSQVAVEKTAPLTKNFGSLPCDEQQSCNVISVDLLEIEPILGVSLVQGDFMTAPIQNEIIKLIGNRKAAVILSDMAPSFTGICLLNL